MAKSASKVFKSIRFAKLDPDHQKAGPFSTDDEEHYTVSTQEYEQQVKHIKKRSMQEAKDPGEYDQEGDMAMTQLRSIMYHAQELHDQLNKEDNLPEWVQSKITLAQDYMQTACDYMYSQKNVKEEVEKSSGNLKDACWTGYTAVGMKMKNGKKVPNCVPVKESKEIGDDPTGSTAQETLVKKGGKTTVAKPIAEASSVAVRMQKALNRIKEKREASEQRGREVLQPKKPEPVKEGWKADSGWHKSDSKTDTVTDKSGAVHTAQSKVRDLARRAMKDAGAKQAKSVGAKPMKESTLVESRKTDIIKDAADSAKKKKKESDKFEANPTLDSQIQKVDNT